MSFDAHADLASGVVATAPSPATSGTSLTLQSGQGAWFGSPPFYATAWPQGVLPTLANSEIVRVTNISTDTFTIVRAAGPTSAQTIGVGWQFSNSITAEDVRAIETVVAGLSSPAATGPSGTAGANSGASLSLPAPQGATGYGLYWLTLSSGTVTLTLPSPAVLGASFVLRATQGSGGGDTLAFASSPQVVFPGVALNLNTAPYADNWIQFICAVDNNSNPTWYGFPATSSVTNLSDIQNAGTARYNLHVPILSTCRAVATTNVAALTGLPTVDSYQTVSGDEVLLTAQSTASQNGPWTTVTGVWTRPSDYPSGGTLTTTRVNGVSGGTAYGGSLWIQTESTDATITIDTTSTTWVQVGSSSGHNNTFGDGSDGAVTLDGSTTYNAFSTLVSGVYTLSRDIYTTNLTINNSVTLAQNNWRIFCTGTLTNNGTIGDTPGSASGTNNGTAAAPGSGTVIGGQSGGSGATGTGATGSKGVVGTGGTGGSGTSGSAASVATGILANATQFKDVFANTIPVLAGSYIFESATIHAMVGGTGGCAGSGDGTNKGGAGGIGGDPVVIFAQACVNNGTITSNGGTGGSPGTVVGGDGCGGGGGGAGGPILIYTLSAVTGTGSTSVTGGSGGTGAGTGGAGGTGGSGLVLTQVLH